MLKKLLLLIFYVHCGFAEDENDLLIKARIYLEAEDFSRADALLKKGEDATINDWEKQYFIYNHALSDILNESNKTTAAPLIQEISPLKFSFPPVIPKADFAKTYSLFSMMRRAYLIKERSPKNVEVLRTGLRQGVQVAKSIKQYEKSACILDMIKGAKECKNSPFIAKILKLAAQYKAEIAHNYFTMRRELFTPIEALLQFLIGQEKLLATLDRLDVIKFENLHLANYLKNLSQEIETFIPIIEKFDSNEIRNDYHQLIQYLRKGDLKKSQEISKKIIQSVRARLEILFSKQESLSALYELFEAYQEAHLEENFQLNTLKFLLIKQEETFKLIGVQDRVPKELMEFAKSHLEKAIHLIDIGNQELGRLEFLFADFAIRSSLFYTIDLEKVPPRLLLRIYISLMSNLAEQDALIEQISNETKEALLWTLNTLVSKTELFDVAVFREEVREFQAMTKRHNDGSSCVASPWEMVLPYFDKGRDDLELSTKLIDLQGFEPSKIIPLHSSVLENWLLALDAIDNPKPPTTCPGGGGGNSEEGENKPSVGGEGIDEVLQNIVQMGEDDKEFEPAKGAKEKEVLKPW